MQEFLGKDDKLNLYEIIDTHYLTYNRYLGHFDGNEEKAMALTTLTTKYLLELTVRMLELDVAIQLELGEEEDFEDED